MPLPPRLPSAAQAAAPPADLSRARGDDSDLAAADDRFGRALRDSLGSFATGVTVMTTCAEGGQAVGITINSFSSVSLDPPLILWSLSNRSPSLDTFRRAPHYAVNVLAEEQEWISSHFSLRCNDHFASVELIPGFAGIPLIADCLAWFECAHEAHYPGGDHLVFVGRILRFAQGRKSKPLVFHGGRYRRLAGEPPQAAIPGSVQAAPSAAD